MTPPRILIVEDETIVARDISQQLADLGYAPAGIISRGEDVIGAAEKLQPDLVLMDIHLAGEQDGIVTAHLVRDRLDLPVVFLTAFAETETLDRAKASDPFGYIIKPFEERELRTVIEIALYKHRSERQEKRSHALLNAILQTARDGFCQADLAGRVIDVNDAAERITGYTREELLGLHVYNIDTDMTAADWSARIGRLVDAKSARSERRFTRKDGTIIDVELSAQFLPDEGGRMVCFFRDITAEKIRTQELELKDAALTAAANAIIITDTAGQIQWANPAFSRLSGYALDEALGTNPRDLIKSDRQDRAFYERLWATVLAGNIWHGELVNRRKNGELYREEMTITPVRNPAGEVAHFIAIKHDVTNRRQMEEALRQSEERYRLLFDHNPLPMWLYDVETLQFLAVNDTAVQKYGYTQEEFFQLTIDRIRPEEDLARFKANLIATADEPLSISEWRHRRKDGSVFPVEVISRPLQYLGRPARLVMAEDITEKKKLEEQYLRAQRLESLGQLASGIAHDLNNMLAPVLFAAPLLRGSVTAERDLNILDTLERSAERGSSLVRQVLAFAQGNSEAFRVTQLKHIARDVVGILEVTLPKSITLETHIPSDAWPVDANPTQIHQVLLNLGVNARDAMPEGGTLGIALKNRTLSLDEAERIPGAKRGDWLVLEVSDTGMGIPPEILPRIWDSFFTTKATGKGTGLGLATVRSIVTAHLGFVEVDTAVGRGTTFRVFLPASRVEGEKPDTMPPIPTDRGREEHVLIVDDDELVRDIIKTVLSQHGYRVIDCADGVEAIVQYNTRSRDIALVITDVDMPNLNGAVLAGTLRKLSPRLRIIAMSGHNSDGVGKAILQEAKELTNAFLAKPFTAAALLKTVHSVLETDPARTN